MNEEIYEGTPAKEDVLIGTDSGYNRYRRPDGSTYIHYPYSLMATVTAYSAKDGKGLPIRTADGKLITGETQAEADRNRFRYDMNHWVEANRRKTAHLPQDWRSKYTLSEGKDILTMTPIAGDILDLGNVYSDFNRGNYGMAAAGLGLMFVPNVLEKPLKWVGKPIIKTVNNTTDIFNGIRNVYNHAKNFTGNGKIERGTKALASVIKSPKYAKQIGQNPWVLDNLPIYEISEYNADEIENFIHLLEKERSKGPFDVKSGHILYLRPNSTEEEIVKSFNFGRLGYENIKLAERYANFLNYHFNKMASELSSDPVYNSIISESPLYIDLVYKSFKRGEDKEVLLKKLIALANSYRRFMNNPKLTAEDFKTFKGSSLGHKGSTIDVEGLIRSDYNGEYGNYPAYFQGQPKLEGPIETWWGLRIPKGVTVTKGMHSVNPKELHLIEKLYKRTTDTPNYDVMPALRTFNDIIDHKYVNYPYHQVFSGPKGTQLPNFEVTVGLKPESFIWGRGYKQGGKLIKKNGK